MPSEQERKLIEMQHHMRENNAYLDDYMKDLNAWTDDMKKKEENPKKPSTSAPTTARDLPPVRNFVEPARPKKKTKKKRTSAPQTSSAIRSYDYRAWDKFDVDAECERLDNEQNEGDDEGDDEEEEEDDENDEEEEQWQEENLKKKAEYYKDHGNHHFKEKRYSEAIEFYTKAIECNSQSPVYFANRAQCQLFEQRYGACEVDCTFAIQLDKNFLKAFYRRALARIGLGKIEQARDDLEYVLSREEGNVEAKRKLEELNRNDEIKRLGRVYPLTNKPVEQRSSKPLKRMEIQEIDTSLVATSTKVTKKKNIVIEEVDASVEPSEQPTPAPSAPIPQSTEPTPLPPKPTSPPPPSAPSTQSQKPSSKATTSIPSAVPTTGYQFKRDWSNLNNQLEQQAVYFDRIPPKSYKTIFSTGLDSSVFSRILLLWSNKTTVDEHLINSMYELRQTPRFDTQLSFLNSADKQLLRTTIQRLQSESSSSDRAQAVLKAYKLD